MMFSGFQANMENDQNIDEAMRICAAYPKCVDCPLLDKPMSINGTTTICMNAQIFQKGSKKS